VKKFINTHPTTLSDLQALTTTQLNTISRDFSIMIGVRSYSIDEIIMHIEKNDEIGREVMLSHLGFLKDLVGESFTPEQRMTP
jgi:hypothetical protein